MSRIYQVQTVPPQHFSRKSAGFLGHSYVVTMITRSGPLAVHASDRELRDLDPEKPLKLIRDANVTFWDRLLRRPRVFTITQEGGFEATVVEGGTEAVTEVIVTERRR